jgi:hypothetical protein
MYTDKGYTFESTPVYENGSRSDSDWIQVILHLTDNPSVFSLHVSGHIYDRTWYSFRGNVDYDTSNSADGILRLRKDRNLIGFDITNLRTDEKIYSLYDEVKPHFQTIYNKIVPMIYKALKDEKWFNDAVKAQMNQRAYDAQVKAERAYKALEDAKSNLQIAELAFIRASNDYVRLYIGDASKLLDENLA